MSTGHANYKPQEAKGKRLFEILQKCQTLDSMLCRATVGSEKGYRLTLVKYCQEMCHELIHVTRRANSLQRGSKERTDLMGQGYELSERVKDMLPVLRDTRCITVGDTGQLDKLVNSINFSYKKWMEKTSTSESPTANG